MTDPVVAQTTYCARSLYGSLCEASFTLYSDVARTYYNTGRYQHPLMVCLSMQLRREGTQCALTSPVL